MKSSLMESSCINTDFLEDMTTENHEVNVELATIWGNARISEKLLVTKCSIKY
jgi:hypothetical protein